MRLSDLLDSVDRRWHQDFIRFIDSGEAGEEFLDQLDRDEALQRAVEDAFSDQAAALQDFARWLQSEDEADFGDVAPPEPERVERRLEAALTAASSLPIEQRKVVAGRAAAAAARSHHRELEDVVHEMEIAVGL